MQNEILKFITPLGRRKVQKTGEAYYKCKFSPQGYDLGLLDSQGESGCGNTDEDDFNANSVDIEFLKSLDPREWKDHDHYAVLGLEKLRFEATDDDIKRAYRRMVLIHHPDKRKAKGENVKQDNDYFTCITKSYEILGNPKLRRSYDSVDPTFDNNLPTPSEIDKDFYGVFKKYFTLNSRWSEKKNVPDFGEENSTRENVDNFYTFWYDFKSWREFSYLDEEDKEKGQDRDERRWIEKENKAMRIKRKKEEMQRIRALVDLAYANDKRIQKFKNEDKERKLAAKRAKMDAAQAQKAEQERTLREAQLARERAEKAEQKRIEQIRIEKEQQKKLQRREKKMFRDKAKTLNYWASNNDKDLVKNMEGIEKICETFSIAELQELNKRLAEKSGKDMFLQALKLAEQKIKLELEEMNSQSTVAQQKQRKSEAAVREVKKQDMWNAENLQLLIKAVNLFPAGTNQRWDVIASYINQHSHTADNNISARDVLNKAKALQQTDFSRNSLKTQANEAAFDSFKKSNKKDVQTCNDITLKGNVVGASDDVNNLILANGNIREVPVTDYKQNLTNGHCNSSSKSTSNTDINTNKEAYPVSGTESLLATSSKTWTTQEQALLEQAIKTYPVNTPERWDRIAECIPNRSRKDCLRRVKELISMVNSKKEAQMAVK